jgi:hypothetical protein
MSSTSYGISNDADPPKKFSGNRKDFAAWKRALINLLNAKGILVPTNRANPFCRVDQNRYCTKALHRQVIMVPTPLQAQYGLNAGDLNLAGKALQSYATALEDKEVKKSYALYTVMRAIEEGSEAADIALPGFTAQDFNTLWFDLSDFFSAKSPSSFFEMAVAQIEFARTKPNGRKPLAIAEKSKLLMTEFQALADISIRPSTMTEGEFAIKKVHAYEKKHFLETFALLLLTSTGAERAMVENYLHRTIDGADETWDGLDPVKRFKEFQQSCASHAVSSVSLSSLPDVMTDNTAKDLKRLSSNVALLKKQLKKAKREATTTTVNTATASHSDGSGSSTKIKAKTCGYCGRKKHDQSVCFSNPHTTPEQRQRAAEHQDRYPSWKPLPALPSYVRVYATQLLLLEADPTLSIGGR